MNEDTRAASRRAIARILYKETVPVERSPDSTPFSRSEVERHSSSHRASVRGKGWRLHAVANAPINGLYQHRARARGPPRAENNLGGGATFHIVLPAFLGEETMVRQRPV